MTKGVGIDPPSTYPLRSQRLMIRPLGVDDVIEFVAYRRDPDVARWQSWDVTYSLADAERLLAGQLYVDLPEPGDWLQLAVHADDDVRLCGDVAVHRLSEQPHTFEIGMTMAPWAQGRGFGAEAVRRVVDHLFRSAGAHRVIGSCDTRNLAARGLLTRIGMRHEAHLVEADFFKDEWTTVDGYAVLAHEWTADEANRLATTA